MSLPGNWAGGVVPTGVNEALFVNGSSGFDYLYNDLTDTSFQRIILTNPTELAGNAFTGVQTLFTSSGSGTVSAEMETEDGFVFSFSSDNQFFSFYNTLTLAPGNAYLQGIDRTVNTIDFSITGVIAASAPVNLHVLGTALRLNGNTPGRVSDNVTVALENGSELAFFGAADQDSMQTVAHVSNINNGVISTDRDSGSPYTAQLTIGSLDVADTGITLFQSGGDELGGTGVNVFLDGQADSTFLGPQSFYLSGITAGLNESYQFAAYDNTRGVIAATTDTDNLDTAAAGANVLVGSGVTLLTNDTAALNSVAFNGDLLDSNTSGGPFVLSVQHLLVTVDGAEIATAVDFGSTDGTITTENWDSLNYPRVGFTGDLRGDGSLTFRGYGDAYVLAAASFNGQLNILADQVYLADGGSFVELDSLHIGATGGSSSVLSMLGSDHGVNIDRISDSVAITANGPGGIALYSDDDTGGNGVPVSETIGSVTVNPGADFAISVLPSDHHSASKPADLTVSSVSFASSPSTGAGLYLEAEGDYNQLHVLGTMITVANHDQLHFHITGDSTRIETPGVSIASGNPDAVVTIENSQSMTGGVASITGDFNLADGSLVFGSLDGPFNAMFPGQLELDGTLTMGASLETYFTVGDPDSGTPYITLFGDLVLGGDLFVDSNTTDPVVDGDKWMLFKVFGGITGSWDHVYGLDGNYDYQVVGDEVYLVAVPEPGTTALFVTAAGILFVIARRRRLATAA